MSLLNQLWNRSVGNAVLKTLLVGGPMTWLLGLSIHSRNGAPDAGVILQPSSATDTLDAYVFPVRQVEKLRIGLPDQASNDEVLKVASAWIEGSRSQMLKPLMLEEFSDTTDFGAKAEVRNASLSLASAVGKIAAERAMQKLPDAALATMMTSLEIASVLRSSDVSAVAAAGAFARSQYATIKKWLPVASTTTKRMFAERLIWIETKNVNLSRVMMRHLRTVTSDAAFESSLSKNAQSALRNLAQLVSGFDVPAESYQIFRTAMESVPGEISILVNGVRTTWQREIRRMDELESLLAACGHSSGIPEGTRAPSIGTPRR